MYYQVYVINANALIGILFVATSHVVNSVMVYKTQNYQLDSSSKVAMLLLIW